MKKKTAVLLIAAAFLAGSVTSGLVCSSVMNSRYSRYEKLEEVQDRIDREYYSETDEQDLIDGACKGLVFGLDDPYSSYMTSSEYDTWKDMATGEYSGIGITFSMNAENEPVIVSVNSDSPAEKGGLKAGDRIEAVDGAQYADLDTISSHIKGREGTKVRITYSRDGKEYDTVITRKKIVQESVETEKISDDTYCIKISSFLENTGTDFSSALDDIEDEGAQNLILDLRDNGGGLVNSCIEVADEFMDEGVVVYVEDRDGNRHDYTSNDGKTGMDTVVLVNENSASASEILAAALQDNGIKLVGTKTFGKGVIQSTEEFDDGSALKLTIMQYFSPSGKAINKKGITPDFKVENSEDQGDAQMEKALSLL